MGNNSSRQHRPATSPPRPSPTALDAPSGSSSSSSHPPSSNPPHPTAFPREAMDVDERSTPDSNSDFAPANSRRRARAHSSGTTISRSTVRTSPPAPSSSGMTFGSVRDRSGLFSRRGQQGGGGAEASGSRQDKKRRRLTNFLGMGSSSSSSAREAEIERRLAYVERDMDALYPSTPNGSSSQLPNSEFSSTSSTHDNATHDSPDVTFAAPPPRPEPVTSSSTEAIDNGSSREDDPLASPRRRVEELIARTSMESLRNGLGTAAYVNPLPPQPPPQQTTSGQVATASNLLSSVLQGLAQGPSSNGRPSSAASTSAASLSLPAGQAPPPTAPTGAPAGLGALGRPAVGTTLIVQGLVQTRAQTPAARSPTPSSTSPTPPPHGGMLRPLPSRLTRSQSTASSSSSTASDAPLPPSQDPDEPGVPSFEEQAALLGGLLSVATSATAASLLNDRPPRPPAAAAAHAANPARPSPFDGIRQRMSGLREGLRRSNSESARAAAPPAAAPTDDSERGIEEVLRNYMNGAFGPSSDGVPGGGRPAGPTTRSRAALARSTSQPASSSSSSSSTNVNSLAAPPPAPLAVPGSFEAFLENIQVDLLRALREYNGLPPFDPAASAPAQAFSSTAPSSDSNPAPVTSSSAAPDRPVLPAQAVDGAAPPVSNAASAVTEGEDGVPRRLNWMMVYRFEPRMQPSTAALGIPADPRPSDLAPSVSSSQASSSPEGPPPAGNDVAGTGVPGATLASGDSPSAPASTEPPSRRVTPMIMVGVRSVRNGEIPEELNQASNGPPTEPASEGVQPTARGGAPDSDGDVQMPDAEALSSSTGVPASSAAHVDNPAAGAGSLTGRVRRALDTLRGRATDPDARRLIDEAEAEIAAQEARRQTSSFVLWVVGGLYNDGHPILTAPGLFTGQMTHEDLWALAELMGNVKPPTASAEDVKNSTLAVIRGSQIQQWVAEDKIIASSADRCAICLEDYEVEDECRVLGCRHVYHQPCVDAWITKGRNACPSCRTKGVTTAADRATEGEGDIPTDRPSTTSPTPANQ